MTKPTLLRRNATDPSTGKIRRSTRSRKTAQLAAEYDRLRRVLWRACGEPFRAAVLAEVPGAATNEEAFVAAARVCDTGFRLSRPIPGTAREFVAAKRAREAVFESARGLIRVRDGADVEHAGVVALLTAIDRFDPARGCALATFAFLFVVSATSREVRRSSGPIDLPAGALTDYRQADAARTRHYAETGERIAWPEICTRLGWPASRARVLAGVERAVSGVRSWRGDRPAASDSE